MTDKAMHVHMTQSKLRAVSKHLRGEQLTEDEKKDCRWVEEMFDKFADLLDET